MLRALLEAADGPAAVHELLLGPFSARVVVADGQVLSARAGPFVDDDALFRLLLVPRRPVRSQTMAVASSGPPVGSAAELLERFGAFARDLERQSARAGGFSRVWAVRFVALKEVLNGLPDDVKRVVRLLDGTRDLRSLIAESPLAAPLTLRVVERLLQRGALERADLKPDLPEVVAADDGGSLTADRSWLQDRTSKAPEPAPPVLIAAAVVSETPAPIATTTTTPAAPLVLERRREPAMAGALPGAIPAPRSPQGAELSAWLGPEDAFFAEPTAAPAEPPAWDPSTLLLLIVAGMCIGAVIALVVVR
ncbi:MAG: hypothetical protein Q8O67_13825 [Deltaproteobacteria bacterium]|nr:hypothetical protein [Deltaproteobacteria bacterium]